MHTRLSAAALAATLAAASGAIAACPPGQTRNCVNFDLVPEISQQIVAKVISQVSVQHARQDKVATDTIMARVLTPAQQASYKVHQMN